MDAISLILIVLPICMLIAMWVCAKKEPDISGFYKQIKVCGRLSSYLLLDFLVVGIIGMCVALVWLIQNIMGTAEVGALYSILLILLSTALMALGLFIYARALKKCPEDLKPRLFRDMLWIGMGFSIRVSFFILMFIIKTWWELHKPVAYMVNGRTVYAYPGSNDLYDEFGNRVGITDSSRSEAYMDTNYS